MKKRGTSLLSLPGSLRPPLARSQTSPTVIPKERYPIREMACGLSTVVYVDDETMHLDILHPYVNKDTTLLAVSTPQLLTTRSTYRLMKSANTFKLNFPGSSPQESAKSPRALSPSGRPRGGKFMPLDITSLLHGAIIGGDTKLVKSILIQEYESSSGTGRLDLNCSFLHNSSSACTILHTAAKYNRTDIIEFIFAKSNKFIANLEATDNLGATPLFYAAASGAIDTLQLLIMVNAEVNKKDHYGFFPLLVSLRNEKYEIADQLLLAGADIHSKTFVGDTALHVLIQDQAPMRSIQFLLARGASLFRQNAKRETPLFAALHNHDLFDFLLYWLNTSQQRQHESFIPIIKALSMTNDLGQSVIHRNCEIKGTTGVNNLMAIINALPFGNTSLLAIPNILSEAESKFSLNMVFSKNKRTPRGSTPTFYETLLNEQDANSHTPLMLAVLYDNTQLVDVLVTALETKLDIKNSKDETALEMAVRLGRPEAMTHIIAAQKYQPARLQRKKSKAEIILGA